MKFCHNKIFSCLKSVITDSVTEIMPVPQLWNPQRGRVLKSGKALFVSVCMHEKQSPSSMARITSLFLRLANTGDCISGKG
jgi:hypothetical protein